MTTTTNLADFGMREIEMLRDILDSWIKKGLPDDFGTNEVVPMLNKNSGYVFLTNDEYDVCMLVGGVLCSIYSCPECGHEGFAEDMREDGADNGYICNHRCPSFGAFNRGNVMDNGQNKYNIPAATKAAIDKFSLSGIRPSGFVMALLANDLTRTIQIADSQNFFSIKNIIYYVFEHIPHKAWGNYDAVESWITRFNQKED
jgi:hypothetical protein